MRTTYAETTTGEHPTELKDPQHTTLRHTLEHAAHLLPAQGPITVFIHHNTLHAFEHLTFDQAVRHGGNIFGCEPYLTEERYRLELARGRIRFDELRDVLLDELGPRAGDSLVDLATRLDLRLAMIQHSVWSGPVAELRWYMAEAQVLKRVRPGVSAAARGRLLTETRRWVMRDLRGRRMVLPSWAGPLLSRFRVNKVETWDESTWEAFTLEALWRICCTGVETVPTAPLATPAPVRHRNLLLEAVGVDADQPVHEFLVRFCAAFIDQGMAHWLLPERDGGLYHSFLTLYAQPGGPPDLWLASLANEATRLLQAGVGPLASIAESLDALGVQPAEWDDFLSATFLALRGWGGIIHQVAQRGDAVAYPIAETTLIEFLAIRLLLDRLALASIAQTELGYTGPLASLRNELLKNRPRTLPLSIDQRAFPVFQLAQVMGWAPADLYRLTPGEWSMLVGEIEAFSEIERRRVFHLSYERRFRTQSLDAVALHARAIGKSSARARFQVVTCLDEREESFRRHVEEVAADAQTFGAAGFFGVAMYYRGAADARFIPLCPIVLTPQHWVEEQVCDGHEVTNQRRARVRKALGTARHWFHVGSRSFTVGAALSAGLGVLASVPLVARILFPRLAGRIGRLFGGFVQTPPATRLQLERREMTCGPTNGHRGYSLDEMSAVTERLLRDIGLTTNFARLVFILGHGSDSLNNPHKSAYDCGACGGSPGAPNGRALAQMLNDQRVRQRLVERGIVIPADVWFVGGFHNTCDDSVTLTDLDRVPDTHRSDIHRAQLDFQEICDRNAHERCRRFMSAPLDLEFDEARQHVEGRSEDLAQTRPELGHATNALCIVARRERTRGLYLDRRAFLTSYDPEQDDAEGNILARILAAAVPVCAGINLEYYFSHVDSQGYGCGTKLPHNLTSLLGVMDGAASDLRTGLPWQMVEIHEPVRLLFVVETTEKIMLGIMERNPTIGSLVRNEWVQLAILEPTTGAVRLFERGAFQPYQSQATQLPIAETSADWYRGWREHLEFAQLGK